MLRKAIDSTSQRLYLGVFLSLQRHVQVSIVVEGLLAEVLPTLTRKPF